MAVGRPGRAANGGELVSLRRGLGIEDHFGFVLAFKIPVQVENGDLKILIMDAGQLGFVGGKNGLVIVAADDLLVDASIPADNVNTVTISISEKNIAGTFAGRIVDAARDK